MSTLTSTIEATKKTKRPQAPEHGPIPEDQIITVSGLFKMLGDPTRLKIISLLGDGEMNVTQLCAALGQSQPAVSHHLALMRVSDLVDARRSGKHVTYSITHRCLPLTIAGRAIASSLADKD